ncbi:MAG: putative glycosyltransferase [Aeromicrobium sp.]|nr:putative glycosyltransferase [Aeromicrobium sp.]
MANDVTFCLIVPSGTWQLGPLAAALRTHHPGAAIVAVWCGDPHLRPVLEPDLEVTWADADLAEPSGAGWGLLLAALRPRTYEWCRASVAVQRLLAAGAERVVALRVGSAAVLGSIDAMLGGGMPMTVVSRTRERLPNDGLSPTEDDLTLLGRHSVAIAAFRPTALEALAWLAKRSAGGAAQIGPVFDRMVEMFGADVAEPSIVSGGWSVPNGDPILAIDLDAIDPTRPWMFDFGSRPSRVRLSAHPALAAAVRGASDQIVGTPAPVCLPGGVAIDEAVRTTVAAGWNEWRDGSGLLPPEPWSADSARFLRWLEEPEPWAADIGRYWLAVRDHRADLLTVFPQPQSTDEWRFREWIEKSWQLEPSRSSLLRASSAERTPFVDAGRASNGLNVVGYLAFDQSLGHIAREIIQALNEADVPVAPLNHERTRAWRSTGSPEEWSEVRFETTIAVVNADQFEFLVADHGPAVLDDRRTIGYWFWELEDIPDAFETAIDRVDEIWTGSSFVTDAFARVTDKPVRTVPLPVPEPRPSDRDRSSMGVPSDAYVFVTTFDFLSVPERKNPFGSIAAFRRAFREGEGPVLLVKSINGSKEWRNHERLLLAVEGRSDIVVWDEHLSRADQMAVLAAANCVVSLHRSEGLGLHCAEAMWLGKPVIATRYSGNVDFMDDSVSILIDHELVPVEFGEGVYPNTSSWADPDLDQAAMWMRTLVESPEQGVEIGRRARARMLAQPSLAATGSMIASLAGVTTRHPHPLQGDPT